MFCHDTKAYNVDSYVPVIEFKSKNRSNLKFLLDTGASSSCVDSGIFNNEVNMVNPIILQTVGGEVKTEKMAEIPLFQPYNNTKFKFLVSPNKLPINGIIGIDIMTILKAQIDLQSSKFIVSGMNYPIIRIPCGSQSNSITIRHQHLNDEEKNALFPILNMFKDIFQDPDSKLTFVSSVTATIDTKDDKPVYTKTSHHQNLLQRKYRIVIDYKALNSKTKTDSYQVPEVSVVLAHLKNNKYFTTLDLASGFDQTPLHKKDREKTAFSVNNGKYQFNRMPMGLKMDYAKIARPLTKLLKGEEGHVQISKHRSI